MDKPLIYLLFTDDWELRGDGSGDIERIQFEPMRQLLDMFEKRGMRCTFMAEMMQQLTFREQQDKYPELKTLAERWDEHVRDAIARGHDVQLHLHTQWSDAVYQNSKWQLNGSWSMLNYEPADAAKMITDGKSYLENVIQPVEHDYKCVAFRASYLAAAPSPTLLYELADQHIGIDTSICGGVRVDTDDVQFDYTMCDEDFQPFYPDMTDARRVSTNKEPVICAPIFHFNGSRVSSARQIASKVMSRGADGSYTPLETSARRASLPAKMLETAIKPVLFGRHYAADVSKLDLRLLREMLAAIRKRATESGVDKVPVVITNHSKYMTDFHGFDQFLGELAAADDIKTLTMTQLASMLRAGEFEVKTRLDV